MDSSTNFNHFDNLEQIIWLVVNNAHILEHRLQSKGSFITVAKLANIVTLKKKTYASNFNSSSKGGIYIWFSLMFYPWQWWTFKMLNYAKKICSTFS
jgi:hypothetical protein